MKTELTKDGYIKVTAETPMEAKALKLITQGPKDHCPLIVDMRVKK